MGGTSVIHGVDDEVIGFVAAVVCFLPVLLLLVNRCFVRTPSPVSTDPAVVRYRSEGSSVHRSSGDDEPTRPVAEDGLLRSRVVSPLRQQISAAARHDDVCPICICDVTWPCEAGCGHVFCTACFHGYWSSVERTPLPCPCCRRDVTLLLSAFESDADPAQAAIAIQQLREYNTAVGQPPYALGSLARQGPVLVRRLVTQPFAAYSILSLVRWSAVILMTFLYLLSPLDLVPETVFGVLGLLDDTLVVVLALVVCLECFRQHLLSNQQ